MSLSFELFWSTLAVKTKVQELGHRLADLTSMESHSSSNASSTAAIARSDIETNAQDHDSKKGHLVRVWRVPVPVRKGYITADLFKNVAILMTLLCIAEFVWIQRIRSGLVRVHNDPYDLRFDRLNRDSPKIWDEERQDFIRNALPVPVHSHNDYWRKIPLFEALGSGCISVEADVHLKHGELFVAHKEMGTRFGKTPTLRELYLEPLERMLNNRNADLPDSQTPRGIFDRKPEQTVVLLVDQKGEGSAPLEELNRQLQPLRNLDYLTYWNGTDRVMRPLTIVATGKAPFESILALNPTKRDIFFDAPLAQLVSVRDDYDFDPPRYGYNISNSYFASTNWYLARLHNWDNSGFNSSSIPEDFERSQLEQARARGLVTRYWGTPSNPPNSVDIVWRVLVEKKVGVVNMDDMGEVRQRARGWGKIEL